MAVDDGDIDFDLLAASLRADASDMTAFMEVLANKLEATLPGSTVVKRVRSGFRGPKQVQEIQVTTSSARMLLRRQGGAVMALRARTSGGITLKTEDLGVDAWLGALTEMLSAEAQRSLQTRESLARLLDTT